MEYHVALSTAIIFGVAGQTLLKFGANNDTFISQLVSYHSVVGLVFYGLAAIAYMYSLRGIPVSVAFSE